MNKIPILLIGITFIKFTPINCDDTIEKYLCENQPANTRLPHPEICDVYLICSENTAVQIRCDGGILFNPFTGQCDPGYTTCSLNGLGDGDERDAGENEENDYDEEEEEPEEGQDEDEDEDEGTDTGKEVEPTGDNKENGGSSVETAESLVCPRFDTEQVTFVTHTEDCSLYYLCYHGKPIPFQCTLGMHWSNEQKKCVPRELSECKIATNSIQSGCPARGLKFMPHPKVCQYFVFCVNGAKTTQRCEAFYHWDVNEQKCKLKTLATCYYDVNEAITTASKKVVLTNKNKNLS